MRSVTRVAVALGAALALTFAPCLPVPKASAAAVQIEPVPSGVTRLLEDYGRAFERKDASLLEGTMTGRMARAELASLRRAARVPFRRFVVRATTHFSGDLASPRIRRRYPGLEVVNYHVLIETALDVEREPYLEDTAFTFVRRSADPTDPYDGWRLTAKDDLDVLGFFAPHNLWDEDDVAVLRSEHFVLLTHPSAEAEMRPVIALAERAYDRAAEFWPGGTRDRYVIVVPTTTAELSRVIRAPIDFSKFVAFVAASVHREGDWRMAGPRMYIHLDHLRAYGEAQQLSILAHELLHAITRPRSGPHIPAWVEEGVANVASGMPPDRARAAQGTAPSEFPTDELFVSGPVRDIQRRYDQSQIAIEVLIDAKGKEGVRRFYEALGAARVVAGSEEYHLRRAIEAIGWSHDEWLAQWRRRLG